MRKTSARRLLLAAPLLVALVLLAVFGLSSRKETPTLAGPLPSQTLVGPTVTLAALRGKPVIVTFWASWCGPCGREASALERFSRQLHGEATLVGVNWSDALSGARTFLREHAWSFPNLRDAEGMVGNAYGLTGLPTTFVIDSSGRIRQTLRGPQSVTSLTHALAQLPT